ALLRRQAAERGSGGAAGRVVPRLARQRASPRGQPVVATSPAKFSAVITHPRVSPGRPLNASGIVAGRCRARLVVTQSIDYGFFHGRCPPFGPARARPARRRPAARSTCGRRRTAPPR